MTQRPWETVVAAILRLGCEMVDENEFRVIVCRGAAVLARIRKISPVPVRQQRHLIELLGFQEGEYLAALGNDPGD